MTGIVHSAVCLKHQPGAGHPESPARLDAVLRGIGNSVPAARLLRIASRCATRSELELCHTPEYIETAEAQIRAGYSQISTGDTDVSEGSWEAALHAAGGVFEAIDAVMAGRAQNAFCAVRPPGHHASAQRGMGFCLFNNVALGARYIQQKHGVERILIADWDVHHGNGTQDIFYTDPTVFFFSTHQWPFYPGSGAAGERGLGKGKGYTLNCPFPRGAGRLEVVGAFQECLLPAMRRFQPGFVLVSAGFDGRRGDPIGQFVLSDADYAELTRLVLQIAAASAGGRLVSVLEGGYDLAGLASACGAHVSELAAAAPYQSLCP